jgi:hypothetical protein
MGSDSCAGAATTPSALKTVATIVAMTGKRDEDIVDNNPVAGPPLSR